MKVNRARSTRPRGWAETALMLVCWSGVALGQNDAAKPAAPETTEQKVERLTAAMSQVQAQMEANQKLLLDLQEQLIALRQQMVAEKTASPASTEASTTTGEIKERQAIDEAQIATHELTKVETKSKYPLTVSGLILFNAFINTDQVDVAAAPAYAVPGSGSTGLSLRQTVLGLDARGPHWMGASSHADVRVDFFGSGATTGYTSGMLRLRTAHAGLIWPNAEFTVELDRTILVPHAPTSLLAVGQPELAWAGNLWTWNPQLLISQNFEISDSKRIVLQAGLIDASDPHLPGASTNAATVTRAELSRWPGTEARIAFQSGPNGAGPEIGIGGYFSPHRTADNTGFNAWAGTADLRLPVARHFEWTANAYRGQALGGLGGGGYADYYYQYYGSAEIARALDDVGGWTQLKARIGQRIEINNGYGIDNPFAKEIHLSIAPSLGSLYSGLAKNRSYFGNAIYSPSAYLQFSLEYRRLWSNFATGTTHISDVIGIGAGYSF